MFKEFTDPMKSITKAFKDMEEISTNKIKSGVIGKDVKPSFFSKFTENTKKKDVTEYSQVVKNKLDGCGRENEGVRDTEKKYPVKEGYKVCRERELCDRNGNAVVDEQTGQKRRIDIVVVKDGKVVDMVEVTSKTAPKQEQLQKEYRIRSMGGNYIKDDNGNVCRIPNNVETRVDRRE